MAITLVTAAPNPALVGNKTRYILNSDKYKTANGSKAIVTLEFGSTSNGQKFGLRYSEDLLFEFKTTPDEGGFEMPLISSDPTFSDFVDAFKLNFYINRDWDVTVVSPSPPYQLQLEAKQNGVAYSVTIHTNTALTGNTTTPGVDDVYSKNFKAITEIYVKKEGDWVLAATVDSAPADNGDFEVYVQEAIKSFYVIPLPATNYPGSSLSRFQVELEIILKYYLRSYENYGVPALNHTAVETGSQSSPKLAFGGGLNWLEFPNNNFNNTHVIATVSRQFFTNYKNRIVSPLQIDFLMWYTNAFSSGSDNFNFEIDLYYTNGQSSIALQPGLVNVPGSQDKTLWQIVIDVPFILTLAAIAGRTVDYFKVRLDAAWEGAGSEEITFTIDRDYKDFNNFFLFRSRLGYWESYWCHGPLREKQQFENIKAELEQQFNYSKSGSDVFTYNHQYQKAYVVNTGLKSQTEINRLQELFDSDEIYILDGIYGTENAFFRRVIVDVKSDLDISNPLDDYFEHSFEFKNAFQEYT